MLPIFEKIKPGDILISKKGLKTYLGYGIVESDYFFDDSVDEYQHQHRLKVKWIKVGNYEVLGENIVQKTLTEITQNTEYVESLLKLFEFDYGFEKNILKDIVKKMR